VLELKENYLKQCYAVRRVTTSIGAESMRGDLPWNGFIANDIETFVMKSVQLYQDERLWLPQENGIEIINHRYVRILFENDFKGRLNGCRIICNSIVHLILWGHCCSIIL
jgi:hypothetical protein